MQTIVRILGASSVVMAVAGVPTTGSAHAQGLSIAPTIGVYAPTADLLNTITTSGSSIAFRQRVGLAVGGRLGLSFGRVGITATGSYVPTRLQATITETGLAQNAQDYTALWFGTGRLNLWLLPRSSPLSLGVNGGVGLVGRGPTTVTDSEGNIYSDVSRTDWGGVVGGTVGLNLGIIGVFASVDDYIYNPSIFEQLGVKSETQNDLQFSFGFGSRF